MFFSQLVLIQVLLLPTKLQKIKAYIDKQESFKENIF